VSRESISLPPGRRQAALSEPEMRRAETVFRALDYKGRVEFDARAGGKTRFVVRPDESTGEEEGVIIIGPDLYPGLAVANPNSVLDPTATAAHEITHYIRWQEGRELPVGHLDEAMTSLQAICTFKATLSPTELEQLVSDALERLIQFASETVQNTVSVLEHIGEPDNAD
jgi:hypothetical protein